MTFVWISIRSHSQYKTKKQNIEKHSILPFDFLCFVCKLLAFMFLFVRCHFIFKVHRISEQSIAEKCKNYTILHRFGFTNRTTECLFDLLQLESIDFRYNLLLKEWFKLYTSCNLSFGIKFAMSLSNKIFIFDSKNSNRFHFNVTVFCVLMVSHRSDSG